MTALAAAGVSEREREVFALLGERLSHAEIAARLFISLRTVESHVASLRRKLAAPDRQALLRLAEQYRGAGSPASPELPAPPSSFVGRAAECAALRDALGAARLVSVVGPGGVGKTRLAVAVVASVAAQYPGGVWYVDLVPVTDPAQVPTAVRAAAGVSELVARSAEEALVAGLRRRRGLLVLDNCEHLSDPVAVLVERLLSECGELTVLATSRVRLVVPFEHVYPVPGLSMSDGGDATALFSERAAAAGAPIADRDRERAARICGALGGLALAIELAAARLPALGLDGLEAGLSDQLGLLTGGARLQGRQTSLQATLEWSYRLLGETERAVLRRVALFAAPFDAAAATAIAGFPPVPAARVPAALARLCEHSLLVRHSGPATRYSMLEPVRQFAAVQQTGEDDGRTRARHLRWCLVSARHLLDERAGGDPGVVDPLADEARAALGWATGPAGPRDEAYRLALLLAGLLFRRGRPGEAQRRYEQAAELAGTSALAAAALEAAAEVAKCRVAGVDGLRLQRAAAAAHLRASDPAAAAVLLARAVEFVTRFQGMFTEPPPLTAVAALMAEARRHAGTDPRARAALLAAEAHSADPGDPDTAELAGQALEFARGVGDPLLESGLLDLVMLLQIHAPAVGEAAATATRRVDQLSRLPPHPATAFELKDALHGAIFTAAAAGDLTGAVRFGERHIGLGFLHAERDLAVEDAIYPHALAGNFERVLALAVEYRDGWERAGRRTAPGRGLAPAAVVMVHTIRGNQDARREWLGILARVRGIDDPAEAMRDSGYGEVFEALGLLHHGRSGAAYGELTRGEKATSGFYGQLFHQWQVALRAEAAVLSGRTDAAAHLAGATRAVAGNPLADAIVARTRALAAGDTEALLATAHPFADAGCAYQHARTLVLAGGQHLAEGMAELAALGALPPAGSATEIQQPDAPGNAVNR